MNTELLTLPQTPDFELQDQLGKSVRLSQFLSTGPMLLVFYRGHWCPYCRRYLSKIQRYLHRFQDYGAQVVAVGPEPPATSLMLSEQLGLEFSLLSDTRGELIDAYGTRNRFASAPSLVPHPAVIILDHEGNVRFKSIDRNYKRRTTMRTLLTRLEELSSG